ncbi:MAG: GAF domain-containing protein, partial [Calditrichaeota bacterium]|nr:GAF domain-containing protein [Calditrichota bacterium]
MNPIPPPLTEIRPPGSSGPAAPITRQRDVGKLLDTVLGLAVELMNADRGAVVLQERGTLTVVASRNLPPESARSLTEVSTSVVRQAIDSATPVLVHDVLADSRYGQQASVVLHQITSVVCAPMFIADHVAGAIYLDSRLSRQRFTDENLDYVDIFAKMAAIALDYALSYSELFGERQRLQTEVQERWRFEEIVGRSPRMQEVFNLMRRVMNSDISVLLEGESGTGKELVARALHYNSPRRERLFVTQFCGNLAESLLESELFGHKKGSFTGAIADKKGLFEIADGGTFLLDEIADISPTIQTKLLRVLQDGEIRRVGDTESRRVNVRIISATNKSLKAEVDAGRFREDLYYRLNVLSIHLPALRERTGDIPLLAQHFLKVTALKTGTPVKRMTPRALQAMANYHWPGNVRELENTIERAHL